MWRLEGEDAPLKSPRQAQMSLWVCPGVSQTKDQERSHPKEDHVLCLDLKSPKVQSRNLKPSCSGGGEPPTLK